ncbi:MAG: hypothetical protein LAO31_09325 [Acidobacteriia bacterium]|nr:hypothetical protein [Terriglobia bacterium]
MTIRTDVFTRICLVTILLLLTLIAARPLVWPPVTGANVAPQYKTEIVDQGVVATEPAAAEMIQQRSREGWQLVAATVYWREYNTNKSVMGPLYLLVFRK